MNTTFAQTIAKAKLLNKSIELIGINIKSYDFMPLEFKYIKIEGKHGYGLHVGYWKHTLKESGGGYDYISPSLNKITKNVSPNFINKAFWLKPKFILYNKVKQNSYTLISTNGLFAIGNNNLQFQYIDDLYGLQTYKIKKGYYKLGAELEFNWGYEFSKYITFDFATLIGAPFSNKHELEGKIENIQITKNYYTPGGGLGRSYYLNFIIGFNYLLHAK